MMDIFTIIGYIAAISLIIYFAFHLFQTVIRKKKVVPKTADMVYYIILCIAVFVYVIARKDYPLMIFFSVMLLWAILGTIDRTN